MLPSLLRPRAAGDVRDQFVIAPHHPDRLGRPPGAPGAIEHERFQQALTWNVFRTLELVAPAFWLRRFHTRLTGGAAPAAPHVLNVSLWRRLPLPPIQQIDGARPEVVTDVVIETEHAVWTLIVAGGRDLRTDDDDRAAGVIDAGAWLAGARDHYFGVIEVETDAESIGGLLRNRYSRSRDSVGLRSATRGPTRPTLTACGTLRWSELAAILSDCAEARSVPPIERALARNALTWLAAAGIEAAGDLPGAPG